MRISSATSSRIKALVRDMGKEMADGRRRIVLEGPHLVGEALHSGRVRVTHLFLLEADQDRERFSNLRSHPSAAHAQVVLASESVIRKLSSTTSPQGILAVGDALPYTPEELYQVPDGLIVVGDGIQDPGNLGSLIRTSDFAGSGGVLLLPGCADPWVGKALRSTAGSLFHLPVVKSAGYEMLDQLIDHGYHLFGAEAHEGTPLFNLAFPPRTALIFGSEGQGLTMAARGRCEGFFTVPSRGQAESMNVTAAAAVSIFEYVRQEMVRRPTAGLGNPYTQGKRGKTYGQGMERHRR